MTGATAPCGCQADAWGRCLTWCQTGTCPVEAAWKNMTAVLPDESIVTGCWWDQRFAILRLPDGRTAEQVTFTSDPDGDYVIVETFDPWKG
jgi:hypothetical protein